MSEVCALTVATSASLYAVSWVFDLYFFLFKSVLEKQDFFCPKLNSIHVAKCSVLH